MKLHYNLAEATSQNLYVTGDAPRLDKYVAESLGVSRSVVQKWCKLGYIKTNDKINICKDRLYTGDNVKIEVPEKNIEYTIPRLKIFYENEDVLVINKEAGCVVHEGNLWEKGTIQDAISECYPQSRDLPRCGILHRLDKDTTGLMVIAKNIETYDNIKSQFITKKIERKYFVMVQGRVYKNEGVVDAFIDRHRTYRTKMAVYKNQGKRAVTLFKVITRYANHTWLECTLETGRTHQIRVHMKHIGHPVIGDKTYGVKTPYIDRQMLHAYQLQFQDNDEQKMIFCSELPEDIEKAIAEIRNNEVEER